MIDFCNVNSSVCGVSGVEIEMVVKFHYVKTN